ncbi:flagellar biosynthetic protein FliR [Desulfovibrio sp. OttesenSCG-928-A18]|nr:flagellar biosynthetic protein FliR [Desulfovibrio sp. OttesenSCG-928-A18]
MDVFGFDPASFTSFLLTLMRVSLIVFMMPFYGGNYIPNQVKGALCLVLTMAIWPNLSFPGAALPAHPFSIGIMLLAELVLGLLLGICVYFMFTAVQLGGEIMGFQMGFTMLSMADPASGAQMSVTAQILHMVTLILFLSLDGHLILLRGLADSFAIIPPGGLRISGPLTESVLALSGTMFSLAIRIAAPVIAAILMAELTLALMGRAAPQMNLLTLGFPIKIGVGFFFMGILFTTIALFLEDYIIDLRPMFARIMNMAQ